MIDYAIYNSQGEFTSKGIAESFDATALLPGYGIHYGLVFPEQEFFDLDIETVRQKGPRPTENHKFDYPARSWVLDPEYAASQALLQRQRLLSDSDWTDTVSAQERLGDQYAVWQTYRQALRDITTQSGYPLTIIWPTAPV